MANNILIRGEAAIGQANQFVDYGKVIGQRLNIDSLIEQRKQKENQFITDVKNMPDFDYQILSDNMRDPITNALVQTKQSYINSARTLRDYSPNSQQYVDAVNQMNSAKRQFESMDGFVKLYNAGKIDYKESLADMSDGNHNKDRKFLAEIYNPNFKNITVENGEIFFNTETAGKVSIKNLPDYFNKDGASMSEIQNLYMDRHDKASRNGIPYNENVMVMGLNTILAKAGNDGKRSIAFDYGIPSLDPDQPSDLTFAKSNVFAKLDQDYKKDFPNSEYDTWAHDPANDTILGIELNKWLRGAFKGSITSAYNDYDARQRAILASRMRRTGSGSQSENTEIQQLTNISKIIEKARSATETDIVTPGVTPLVGPQVGKIPTPLALKGDVISKEKAFETIGNEVATEYSNIGFSIYPFTRVVGYKKAKDDFAKMEVQRNPSYSDNEEGIEKAGKDFDAKYKNKNYLFVQTETGAVQPYNGDLFDPKEILSWLQSKRQVTSKDIKTSQQIAEAVIPTGQKLLDN